MGRVHVLGVERRTVASAVAATMLVVAPMHLLGALAVLVREDLGFGKAALGTAIAVYNLSALSAAWPAGVLGERLGARAAMLTAGTLTTVAALGIALFAHSWRQLVVGLVVAGFGNGMGQPAAALAIADGVRERRQGLAFGMKQAAVPVAGIVAGLAVPVVGLTVGWRWAYAGIGLGVVGLALLTPHVPRKVVPPATADEPVRATSNRSLTWLIVAFSFGAAAGNPVTGFLAETAVDAGYSTSFAGLLVAFGSAVGLLSRLATGLQADRRGGGHLRVVALMMAVGSLGHVGLAFGDVDAAVLLLGVTVMYAVGWGWPPLLFLAVIRLYPDRPGAQAGKVQAGATVGGLLGPFAFGWLVSVTSFRNAWLLLGATGLVASALVVHTRRRLAAERTPATPAAVPAVAAR